MLYVRMLFMTGVSLYTSRVILNALGVEDFGIYNVVGGVVAIFSTMTVTFTVAISRFITYAIGKGDQRRSNLIFSTSVIIQILIGLIIVILLETIGLWFLENKIVVPVDRLVAAKAVLHWSALSVFISIISVPYNALIIAYERMSTFAYIGIFEAMCKLSVAYVIIVSSFDRLILYSLLTVGVSLLVRIIYGVYCKRNFDECKTFVFTLDRGIFKEMLAFAGWNSVGVLSYTLREHGSNIVLNMFFGPTVNAAKGISTQVLGALTKFSGSFMMALNPQITKTYASDEKDRVMTLVFQGARLSYYMMFLISLPILISTNQILSLWLGVVPEYAIVFVQLSIISSLITTLMTPLLTLMQATGDIRNYQIADACVTLFSLPMSYVLLRMGLYPEAVLVVNIVILSMSLLVQLFMLKGMVGLPFLKFVKEVISNVFLVSVMSTIIPLVLSMYFSHSFGSFILLSIVAILSTVITVYTIGCNETERELIIKTIKQKFSIN